ncbi:hypothetical protein JNUCC1_00201 [Lentibacillus sp. JNUCC-1]|uniref:DUF1129 family protein n=1 Tax=Lentibacillus sp. JNUCC-1 TaxID=2654513 RepID=UPI0012E856F6|nr:DUF1129 family protein [Lentibacillus sp. JNUCC-1]MUV36399.1 hypothetical protein [Lentibacillus sp. JNUCC-1]
MTTEKELIKENNEKRKELTPENLQYYEDMLVYIRLSFSKSDIATEEILSELLEHLLEAQAGGKTAHDVFGDDPKGYADDIIGALPQKMPKNFVKYFLMGILYFLGSGAMLTGLINIVMYHIFSKGAAHETIHLGGFTIKTLISIPAAFFLTYILIQYLRWSTFKNIGKKLEFFILWLYGVFSIGLFMLIIYFTPDIGPEFHFPHWGTLILGAGLFVSGWITMKKV